MENITSSQTPTAIAPETATATQIVQPTETRINKPTQNIDVYAIATDFALTYEAPVELLLDTIYDISISSDGEILVVTTSYGVWIYSIESGEVLHFFKGEPQVSTYFLVSDIAWSPDGTMLAVGALGNGVWVWDVQTWELLTERYCPVPGSGCTRDRTIYHPGIAWSPDGQYLAVGSGVEAVWVWEKNSDTWEDWSNYSGYQYGITWTQDGQLLMAGADRSEKGIFDVRTGEFLYSFNTWIDGASGKIVWSPDERLVLILFDLGGGVLDPYNDEYAFWARTYPEFAWSPDGSYFVTFSGPTNDGWILWIYDTKTYELILDEILDFPFVAFTWTSEGELLGVRDIQGQATLINVLTNEILLILE